MKINRNTDPKTVLDHYGITYKETNSELVVKCIFSDCDTDSRPNEAHLYISCTDGLYQCKKCLAEGNLFKLNEFLGGENYQEEGRTKYRKSLPSKRSTENVPPPLPPETVEKLHAALPDRIREYLHQRGITDDSIAFYKIGYGEFYGQNWITIPIFDENGNCLFFKLRRDPDSTTEGEKYIVDHKGVPASLFGIQFLKENPSEIAITEGELDCIILNQQGLPAITSTAGSGGFKEEWVDKLKGIKKIYLCFDKDDSGQEASTKLAQKIYEQIPSVEVYTCVFPERMTEGKDITDYFTKYDGNIDELMNSLLQKVKNPLLPDRIIKVPEPKNKVTFEEWKEVITKNFPEMVFPAEVCLSVVTQMLINDITNPFGVVLVDVPSSGKTITLNFFSDIENITYVTDKFTPASFISNSANIKKEDLKKIDLLPRLRYKTFIIRDLATIFSKREDDLSESLGILTRVMDGEGLATDTGVHGQRHYSGEFLFMMLAASTPIPPRVQKTMGTLGARLFFLNMNSKDVTEDELVSQAKSKAYKQKERECRAITQEFIHCLWYKHQNGIVWDITKTEDKYLKIIARCARLLARLRGVIDISVERHESFTEEVKFSFTMPVIEKPMRINQLFNNITKSHAAICGRDYVDEEDIKLIIELSLDSAPSIRAKLFKALIEHSGTLKTSEVEKILNCSKVTALKEMQAMTTLGIVFESPVMQGVVGNQEKQITLTIDFTWFFSEECRMIREGVTQKATNLNTTS